ncbi:MAG: DUF2007 domain-containing protein [Chloroflexi bacterium]|nr:DUF2007 domain-containing protein [Chloroflexota bacterium]
MKWVVFATAPDQLTAEMWREIVRQAGISCELRAGDTASYLGLSRIPVRLIAPESDSSRARAALSDALGEPLTPEENRG